MWVSGSLIASRIVRSSSVSSPSMTSIARLPQAAVRSRTTRGNLLQTFRIGCIRVFITPSCRSLVMRFRRCEVASIAALGSAAACCMIWLRVRTSSPTRFMIESSRFTSTRIEVSTALCLFPFGPAGATEAGGGPVSDVFLGASLAVEVGESPFASFSAGAPLSVVPAARSAAREGGTAVRRAIAAAAIEAGARSRDGNRVSLGSIATVALPESVDS